MSPQDPTCALEPDYYTCYDHVTDTPSVSSEGEDECGSDSSSYSAESYSSDDDEESLSTDATTDATIIYQMNVDGDANECRSACVEAFDSPRDDLEPPPLSVAAVNVAVVNDVVNNGDVESNDGVNEVVESVETRDEDAQDHIIATIMNATHHRFTEEAVVEIMLENQCNVIDCIADLTAVLYRIDNPPVTTTN
jgi:hypothetical protein